MEEAIVLGTVVATESVPALRGVKLVWIAPIDDDGEVREDRLVAADVTQSGRGSRVFFVRAREAAEAMPDSFIPIDAAVLGIVDSSRRSLEDEP